MQSVYSFKVPLHFFFDFTLFDRSKCADFENGKNFAIRGVLVELGAVLYPIVVLHEQSGNERISDVIVVRRIQNSDRGHSLKKVDSSSFSSRHVADKYQVSLLYLIAKQSYRIITSGTWELVPYSKNINRGAQLEEG